MKKLLVLTVLTLVFASCSLLPSSSNPALNAAGDMAAKSGAADGAIASAVMKGLPEVTIAGSKIKVKEYKVDTTERFPKLTMILPKTTPEAAKKAIETSGDTIGRQIQKITWQFKDGMRLVITVEGESSSRFSKLF